MQLKKRGQTLVEFALIIPLLLLVIFGLIDAAFIVQGMLTVNHAAREAARFAVTYQPLIGECMTDEDGNAMSGSPWCPGNKNESEEDYYNRRVEMIKRTALAKAIGIRIDQVCMDDSCLSSNNAAQGMFGVRVQGVQSFEAAGMTPDRPGLPGLPVYVEVRYNVPLYVLESVFPTLSFPVHGSTQMMNEGVQTEMGYVLEGSVLPATLWVPTVTYSGGGGGGGEETVEPTTPAQTGTTAASYALTLNPRQAVNVLPRDRSHSYVAHVTYGGSSASGVNVKYRTDFGSLTYSGDNSVREKTVATDGNGDAEVILYSNQPGAATLEAWLDLNGNGEYDTAEPYAKSTKTWTVSGPYLVVSNHYPEPEALIAVQLFNHTSANNPYSLWWCPSPTTTVPTIKQLAVNLSVDIAGYYEAQDLLVPANVSGIYRIESHTGNGACGQTTSMVAYSGDILIRQLSPDLRITDFRILTPNTKQAPGKPLTVTVEISNSKNAPVMTGPFDVDVYLNLPEAPTVGMFSTAKQWVTTLGPYGKMVMTFSLEIDEPGPGKLWAQVDTTNYIMESAENNNVAGPISYDICPGSDDFDAGLRTGVWTKSNVGSGVNGSATSNGNGQLELKSMGTRLWNTPNNFYFVYQSYANDFDARLRILSRPNTAQSAKTGLAVFQSASTTANYVLNAVMLKNSSTGVSGKQIAANGALLVGSAEPDTTMPYWARITREGTTYKFYSSHAERPRSSGDWTYEGSKTVAGLGAIGMVNASYNSSKYGIGVVDDFIICPGIFEEGEEAPYTPPPGLLKCNELLKVPGFEGDATTVFEVWRAGEVNTYRRTSLQRNTGTYSMRLQAVLLEKMGTVPGERCSSPANIYLSQDIVIPEDVYPQTVLTVKGAYFVDGTGTDFTCSNAGHPDPLDKLAVQLRDLGGAEMTPLQEIVTGGTVSRTWHSRSVSITGSIDFTAYKNQKLNLYWKASQNGNYDGTLFYIDDLSAQLCTYWPVPEPTPGTASLGGMVTTLNETGISVPMYNQTVWAYSQAGTSYETTTIQDGTYHFYNIPPGKYTVYSEVWVNGKLRYDTKTVILQPDQREYGVNLHLD